MYAPDIKVGELVYLRKRVLGRNKIQDAWEPTMFTVTEVPTRDGGPYTVVPHSGRGAPKKVSRVELQPCPVKSDPPQPIQSTTIECVPNRAVHEDTPQLTLNRSLCCSLIPLRYLESITYPHPKTNKFKQRQTMIQQQLSEDRNG